jgi:hypothetical protein
LRPDKQVYGISDTVLDQTAQIYQTFMREIRQILPNSKSRISGFGQNASNISQIKQMWQFLQSWHTAIDCNLPRFVNHVFTGASLSV